MKMYLPPRGARRSSRRHFLSRGLLGGALLAAGGLGWLAWRPSAEVVVPPGLKVLGPREFAVLAAIASRVIPPRSGWRSPEALKVAQACDEISSQTDPTAQQELRQLLLLFENAVSSFLFGFRLLPFTRLPPEEQDAVLGEWARSTVQLRRTGFLALRTLVTAAYFHQRDVWVQLGYPGPLPGISDPTAPVWKGGGAARPTTNGTYLETAPEVSK